MNLFQETADRRQIADAVAEATAKRLQPETGISASQRRIREQARKELEEEQRRLDAGESEVGIPLTDERDIERDLEYSEQISSLLYTCDLFGGSKILPKKEVSYFSLFPIKAPLFR
jgi:hypothetical protein